MTIGDSLTIPQRACRYRAMIGTGGIGSGMFFRLNENQTLGREESRSGAFLDRRDYCKLHIIAHYVKALLGEEFAVIPIGKVGDDSVGQQLLNEMEEGGLDLAHVGRERGSQTLFSFCYVYPDGSGGNLTTSDSACSRVDGKSVEEAREEFRKFAGRGIALAAPEVPLAAREALLQLATAHRFFRVASFTTEEMPAVMRSGLLQRVDLLAVNLEEAAAAAGMAADAQAPDAVVQKTVSAVTAVNPAIHLSVTRGERGSWVWDGTSLSHLPALPVTVESTAGAGDAFTAGLIAGVTGGLSLGQAQQLATLCGACSVTSPHTINKTLGRPVLRLLRLTSDASFDNAVLALLEDPR